MSERGSAGYGWTWTDLGWNGQVVASGGQARQAGRQAGQAQAAGQAGARPLH